MFSVKTSYLPKGSLKSNSGQPIPRPPLTAPSARHASHGKKPYSAQLPPDKFACRSFNGESLELPATNAELDYFGRVDVTNLTSSLVQPGEDDPLAASGTAPSVLSPSHTQPPFATLFAPSSAVSASGLASVSQQPLIPDGSPRHAPAFSHAKLLSAVSTKDKHIYDLKLHCDHLRVHVQKMERDKLELHNEKYSLEKECMRIQDQRDVLITANQRMQTTLTLIRADLKSSQCRIIELESKQKDFDFVLSQASIKFDRQMHDLQFKHAQTERDLAFASEVKKDMIGETTNLQHALAEAERAEGTLREQFRQQLEGVMTEKEKALSLHQAALAHVRSMMTERHEVEAQIKLLRNELNLHLLELETRDLKIKDLQHVIGGLHEAAQVKEHEKTALTERTERWRIKFLKSRFRLGVMQVRNNFLESLRGKLATASVEKTTLETKLEEGRKKLEATEAAYEEQVSSLKDEVETWQKECEIRQAASSLAVSEHLDKKQDQVRQVQELEAALLAKSQALAASEVKLEHSAETIATLQDAHSARGRHVERLTGELEEMTTKHDALSRDLASQSIELEDLRAHKNTAQDELFTLRARVRELTLIVAKAGLSSQAPTPAPVTLQVGSSVSS